MSATHIPTWDELLEAGTYTSAAAAALRGVSQTAAKEAARRRGKSWHRSTRKITDEDLRAAARQGLHVNEVAERFGVTPFQIYRRVKPMGDVESKIGRLRLIEVRRLTAMPPANSKPTRTAISASPDAVARFLSRKEVRA